ncbi:hypothetical protein D9M68_431470 [compost metagenome]
MTLRPLLFAFVLFSVCTQAGEVGIAARVNDAEISNFRLERYFADYLAAQGRNLAAIRDPRTYQRLRRAALNDLIDKELLRQEAERRGVRADEDEVRAQLEALRGAFRSPEAFARRLQESGFDEAGYADYLRDEQVARRLLNQLSEAPAPDENDLRLFLEQNPALPARSEQELARARELLRAQRQAGAARAALSRMRAASRIDVARGI